MQFAKADKKLAAELKNCFILVKHLQLLCPKQTVKGNMETYNIIQHNKALSRIKGGLWTYLALNSASSFLKPLILKGPNARNNPKNEILDYKVVSIELYLPVEGEKISLWLI